MTILNHCNIKKIVSGGQTGVDRAALDVAITLKIPHGGWCPLGRKAEDGRIAVIYHLMETPSADYEQRTTWNVRDSDGTLIINYGPLAGGTLFTLTMAKSFLKPYYLIDLSQDQNTDGIINWLQENHIQVLNVAGPRASKDPDIYQLAYDLMYRLFNQR